MNPKVTVLMSVYNEEKYLKESIDSVLDQTFGDFEFLIIDDGSTDNSFNIIESCGDPRIRLIRNKSNIGLIKSLNRGLEIAKGEFIARMDADDLSLKNRLEVQNEFMENHPKIGVCGSWVEFFNETHRSIWKLPQESEKICSELLFRDCVAHPSVMMRKSSIKKVGEYNSTAVHAEDYDLWVRMCKEGIKLYNLNEVLLKMREHGGRVTRRESITQKKTSREVRRKQLKELGIDLTDENLDLHNQLSTLHSNLGRTNLKRILTWKEKLLEANQKEELYHQSSLKEVINDRIRRKSALLVLFYLKNLEIKLLMNTVLEMVKSDKGWLLWLCYQVFKNPVESAKRFWNPV